MACRLFGAKPLSKPMQGYCQLDLRNKLQWNLIKIKNLFIHEIGFVNIVCETAAILSRGRWRQRVSVIIASADGLLPLGTRPNSSLVINKFGSNISTGPGPCRNIRTAFPKYGDSHVKDKTVVPYNGISIIKIRRPWGRFLFVMGLPILVRRHLHIETQESGNPFNTNMLS